MQLPPDIIAIVVAAFGGGFLTKLLTRQNDAAESVARGADVATDALTKAVERLEGEVARQAEEIARLRTSVHDLEVENRKLLHDLSRRRQCATCTATL